MNAKRKVQLLRKMVKGHDPSVDSATYVDMLLQVFGATAKVHSLKVKVTGDDGSEEEFTLTMP